MRKPIMLLLALGLLFVPSVVPNSRAAALSEPEDETLITLGDPITVSGPGAVVSGSTVTIVAGGSFRATGTLTNGMIDVNTTEAVTLTLDDVAITNASGPAIKVTDAMLLSLVLADGATNTLVDDMSYSGAKGALFSNDSLIISGNGALQVTGNYKHGIVSDDDIVFAGGVITIQATTDGIHANDHIALEGATITILQANDGVESEGTLQITSGSLTVTAADDGLVSAGPMTVDGGVIHVLSAVDGLDSKGTLVINDGEISVEVSDTGLSANSDLVINGGQIYAGSAGDAIVSGGAITFNGGVTVAEGADAPMGSLICGESCEIAFNGGVVVATGGAYSALSASSAQRVAVLGPDEAGSALRITRDDSAETLTFVPGKAYQNMVFSAPTLTANRTFSVRTGGVVAGGSNFHGLYTGATYTGGGTKVFFNTDAVVTHVNRIFRYFPIGFVSAL